MPRAITETLFQVFTRNEDRKNGVADADGASAQTASNFVRHFLSLGSTKLGDGLADPKLVLSWLLTTLGAPAYLVGLLVPIREAGALLPQLVISSWIGRLPVRKWVWVAGSVVQGLSVCVMAASAMLLSGATAGWAILLSLCFFAMARSACSVSYKDVLGKTVPKGIRGTATGSATTIASAGVLLFGLALSTGLLEKSSTTIASALLVAGVLWLLAAVLFSGLQEEAEAREPTDDTVQGVFSQFLLLRQDSQLRWFTLTRGLLISTALAPP